MNVDTFNLNTQEKTTNIRQLVASIHSYSIFNGLHNPKIVQLTKLQINNTIQQKLLIIKQNHANKNQKKQNRN